MDINMTIKSLLLAVILVLLMVFGAAAYAATRIDTVDDDEFIPYSSNPHPAAEPSRHYAIIDGTKYEVLHRQIRTAEGEIYDWFMLQNTDTGNTFILEAR